MAVSWASAVPARSWWTECRFSPVSSWRWPASSTMSAPSKEWPADRSCIRCSRPSSNWEQHNAAIARPAFCLPPRRCSSATLTPSRERYRARPRRQPLPLHRLHQDLRGGRACRGAHAGRVDRAAEGERVWGVTDRRTVGWSVRQKLRLLSPSVRLSWVAPDPRSTRRQGHGPDPFRR